MHGNDCLINVEDIGKYFDLTKSLLSRLSVGPRVLKAVDHVSFRIQKGKTLGLVGESGCGKSTVARLITRLIEPSFGRVTFQEADLFGLAGKELRQMRRHYGAAT